MRRLGRFRRTCWILDQPPIRGPPGRARALPSAVASRSKRRKDEEKDRKRLSTWPDSIT